VNSRTGLVDLEMKQYYPYRDSNSDPSAVQSVKSLWKFYILYGAGLSFQRIHLILGVNVQYLQLLHYPFR
jgi:hypothetical protein